MKKKQISQDSLRRATVDVPRGSTSVCERWPALLALLHEVGKICPRSYTLVPLRDATEVALLAPHSAASSLCSGSHVMFYLGHLIVLVFERIIWHRSGTDSTCEPKLYGKSRVKQHIKKLKEPPWCRIARTRPA